MTVWRCVIIMSALLAAALPAGAQESSYMMTGDSQSVWIIQQHPSDKTFDIIAKQGGGKWAWVEQSLNGQPSALAASGGVLTVFIMADGPQPGATDCLYYSFDNNGSTPGVRVSGNVVSACRLTQSSGGASGGGMNILAVTLHDQPMSISRPASQPARTPAQEASDIITPTNPSSPASTSVETTGQVSQNGYLALLSSGPGKWQEIATIPSVAITSGTKIYCCSLEGRVYLLIHTGQPGDNRLLCRDDGQWRDVPLPAALQSAEVFGMVNSPQKPGLTIAFSDHAEPKISKSVALAILPSSANIGFTIQPVVYQGKQLKLAPSAPLQVACLIGKQLNFLWPQGQTMQVASCDGDGQILSQEELPTNKAAVSLNGQKILQYFFWVVLVLIFVPMMLIRPSSPPRPFVLAEGLVAGNLIKRLLAGMIDILPFYLIFVAVFFSQLPALSYEEILAFFSPSQIPDSAAYSMVLALSLYAIYCTIMEMKYSATLGKMIFHLRVVGEGGKSPDMRAVFLRNVMKIAEIVPPSLPLLLLIPLINRNRQRLGDIIARTAVVDARRTAQIKPTQSDSDNPVPPAE